MTKQDNAFKYQVNVLERLSSDAIHKWNRSSRFISKHPFKWIPYCGSKDIEKLFNLPHGGCPVEFFKKDSTLIRFLLKHHNLEDNHTYSLQSWKHSKTVTHCGYTTKLIEFTIHSVEQGTYTVHKNSRIGRYWFRKNEAK